MYKSRDVSYEILSYSKRKKNVISNKEELLNHGGRLIM